MIPKLRYFKTDLERDLPEIKSWYRNRFMPIPPDDLFPEHGFICPGIAAGFMISTNTKLAFLEHFITNPESKSSDRRIAIDKIAEKLIAMGKEQGIKAFTAISGHPSIFQLCAKHGFSEIPNIKVFGRK